MRSGDITTLLRQANSALARMRNGQQRNHRTSIEQEWEQAAKLIEQGQLSRAAKLLNTAGLAPRGADTLAQLSDPAKRPPQLTMPLTSRVTQYSPARPIDFDGGLFIKNLRGARKGGAPGPNGCRAEHLKPILEDPQATGDLVSVAARFAAADVPHSIARALCLCRMVALNKGTPGLSTAHGPSNRVRGLAVGDSFRRLVSRTLAQQFRTEFEEATAPHQFGISSACGVDGAVHLLRTMSDIDPAATITQIDGIGAFDNIRRSAMLDALSRLPTGHSLLPYVLMSYGQQSVYLWEDNEGRQHEIVQGEGGEQRDALMPALFSLGLAQALSEAQSRLRANELVIAYLDDLYIVTSPARARQAYDAVTEVVRARCGIEPNGGKTACWNKAGVAPPGIAELGAGVWRGEGRPEARGMRILGAAFGTAEFVDKFGDDRAADARRFLEKILMSPLTQHAWLLISYCLVPRANHLLRQTPPSLAQHSAEQHNAVVAEAVSRLLGCNSAEVIAPATWTQARLPPRLAGLGLRDCLRTSPAAYWASFADCVPHLCKRFPRYGALLAERFAGDLGDGSNLRDVPSLAEVQDARCILEAEGAELPSFDRLVSGASPHELLPEAEAGEEGEDAGRPEYCQGWQRLTSRRREDHAFRTLLGGSSRPVKARLRSCGGANNSRWLTTLPTCEPLRMRNQVVQVLLRRRLGLDIAAIPGVCEAHSCCAALDASGFHRTCCTRTGRTHGRHAAAIGPWQQVLGEAGYRTRSERMMRDTNIPVNLGDNRRMDIVAAPGSRGPGAHNGLTLFCDLTIASPHTRTGAARSGSAAYNGRALRAAIAKKRNTYSDVSSSGVACLLVLGCEVYGRWSDDAIDLIRQLARSKSREAPPALRRDAAQAWTNRWWGIIGVGVQRAIGEALLLESGADLIPSSSLHEEPTLTDLLSDHA